MQTVKFTSDFREPSGKVYKKGESVQVTNRAVDWLLENGLVEKAENPIEETIEPAPKKRRKNSKEAETRETK